MWQTVSSELHRVMPINFRFYGKAEAYSIETAVPLAVTINSKVKKLWIYLVEIFVTYKSWLPLSKLSDIIFLNLLTQNGNDGVD